MQSAVAIHSIRTSWTNKLPLKRLVKYIATGGVVAGAKLMDVDFLTGDRQGAAGTVHQQARTSAAAA
jgi:hypothetical protein